MTSSKTSESPIPEFRHVRLKPVGNGMFDIVTAGLGNPIGSRLQKSAEPLPNVGTHHLSRASAIANAKTLDAYLDRQSSEKRPSKSDLSGR